MKKKLLFLVLLSILILPSIVNAWEVPAEPATVGSIGTAIKNIVNTVWMLFSGLGVILIMFSGILFLSSNGDPSKLSQARQSFLWGVVGILIGILAFSIITLVTRGLTM